MEGIKTVSGAYRYDHLSSKMEKCPFCGCAGGTIFTSPDKSTAWGHCTVCSSRGPYVIVITKQFQNSLEEAVTEWNTRKGQGKPNE